MAQIQSNIFQEVKRLGRDAYTFRLSPTDVAFANTLRRMILTGVETVGFRSDMNEIGKTTDVEILRNSTPMTNEMLADRIGLLPLVFKDPLQWDPEKYSFHLSVINESPDPRDVTAADIVVTEKQGENGEEVQVPNVQFFPPDPVTGDTALLAILKGKRAAQPPEAIEFRAKATLGTGREHARFIPVSQCAYRYSRDTDERKQEALFVDWLKKSKNIGDPQGLDESQLATFKREYATMEIDRCFLVDENGEPISFDFVVESKGTLDVPSIVKRALQNTVNMCKRYVNLDKEALPGDLRVSPAANRLEGFDFLFQNQDHTLGNLLQSYIDKYLLDGTKVTYVAYNVPHPLRDEMVLRIGVAGGQEIDARKIVAEAARGCVALFTGWLEDWQKVFGAPVVMVKPKSMVKRASASAPGTKKTGTVG